MKTEPGRYIDALSDFGFKFYFGSENHKDILIAFLNDLFEGQKVIKDLIYSPTEHTGDTEEFKKVFFDLICTGPDNERFIIEMQRGKQEFFRERAVFYTSRLINGQMPKGENDYSFYIPEVYFVALLEFTLEKEPANPGRYIRDIYLADSQTNEIFYTKLQYKFIELPLFSKNEEELKTDVDKWLFLLKNISTLDRIPAVLNKRIFQKLFQIGEVSGLTKEERMLYDSGLKAKRDYMNSIAYAKKEGAEEERIKSDQTIKAVEARAEQKMKEAEAKAEQERIKAEQEKAKAEQHTISIVRNLKNIGMPAEEIAKITGMPIDKIQAL